MCADKRCGAQTTVGLCDTGHTRAYYNKTVRREHVYCCSCCCYYYLLDNNYHRCSSRRASQWEMIKTYLKKCIDKKKKKNYDNILYNTALYTRVVFLFIDKQKKCPRTMGTSYRCKIVTVKSRYQIRRGGRNFMKRRFSPKQLVK